MADHRLLLENVNKSLELTNVVLLLVQLQRTVRHLLGKSKKKHVRLLLTGYQTERVPLPPHLC